MQNTFKVCKTRLSGRSSGLEFVRPDAAAGRPLSGKLFRLALCLAFLVFASPENAFSQRGSAETIGARPAGLSSEELTAVLQKCIELPALQKYYPVESGSNLKQVTVVQYPVAFPQNIDVSSRGTSVNFLAHPDPKSPGYFMFRSIENAAGKIIVNYNYFYKGGDASNKILTGTAQLSKTGTTWNVINNNIKEAL